MDKCWGCLLRHPAAGPEGMSDPQDEARKLSKEPNP